MSERRPSARRPERLVSEGEARLERVGAAVVAVWALLVLIWGLGLGQIGGGVAFLIFAVALPLVMLALVVMLLRNLRELRQEAAALSEDLRQMRKAEAREAIARSVEADAEMHGAVQGGAAAGAGAQRAPAADGAATQKGAVPAGKTETVAAESGAAPSIGGQPAGRQPGSGPGFASRRDPARSVPSADGRTVLTPAPPSSPDEEEPTLALAAPPEAAAAPIEVADFVRAIQFPEDAEDAEGFAALRRVLVDRTTAKLIRASQDMLTLLAQEGIYMDNLVPDRARPELWRRFAAGERGRPVAALGGIRDRSSLALTGMKMREDPVFRDTAHHFLRNFDQALAAIEPRASDGEMAALADTRTARAFMLVGRVAGTFD